VQPTGGAGLNFNGFDADWSLQNGSPCIDGGTPDTLGLELPETDIVGNPRISYFRVDMGAFEKLFPTMVGDRQTTEVKIYPNPASNRISIEMPGINGHHNLAIVNLEGVPLINKMITESKTQLDISNLPAGIYFVRLTGEKTVQVGKFVKR
jgi:hypothetical protein